MPGVMQGDPAQARTREQPPELIGVPLGVDRHVQLVGDQVFAAWYQSRRRLRPASALGSPAGRALPDTVTLPQINQAH